MSPTFHVQLFPPTFPPVNIDIEAEKRSFHRRRSTRRLEAAQGTTPLLLDLDSKKGLTITNSPTSPRTRAVRRKGQLFDSPTSPISSTESGYLFANAGEQSDDSDHQLQSPSSTCRQSPLAAGNPVSNDNNNRVISGRRMAGNKAKPTKTGGPQQLAQPYLLHLRSLPVPAPNIKLSDPGVTITPNSLSPTSSSFNMLSTPTSPHPPRDLDEIQKRRKIAKLERFLGENIPPELVFPSSTPLQRSTSVIDPRSRGKSSHKPSRSLPMPSPKTPLSTVPSPVAAAPSTPLFQSTEDLGTSLELQSPTRRQSMTSMPSPTMATMTTQSTRGASLDGGPTSPISPPFQTITVELETTDSDFRKYRKEGKGWSGEWNVKDMEVVANALRGLKLR